jgi:PPOX class probable FMN-dependent enzyme
VKPTRGQNNQRVGDMNSESGASKDQQQYVTSLDELNAIYGAAAPASLLKELDYVSDHYRQMIEKSPFLIIATVGEGGLDCSPRGDPPGFVRVADDKTLLIPDRKGNNRLDTLKNLVQDSRAALIFLIPGVGETLRVNGSAFVSTNDTLRQSFAINGKVPATVIEFRVERIYFQCQKALVRSRLWHNDFHVERSELPSIGSILQALSGDFDGKQYDRDYPERLKKTIY